MPDNAKLTERIAFLQKLHDKCFDVADEIVRESQRWDLREELIAVTTRHQEVITTLVKHVAPRHEIVLKLFRDGNENTIVFDTIPVGITVSIMNYAEGAAQTAAGTADSPEVLIDQMGLPYTQREFTNDNETDSYVVGEVRS